MRVSTAALAKLTKVDGAKSEELNKGADAGASAYQAAQDKAHGASSKAFRTNSAEDHTEAKSQHLLAARLAVSADGKGAEDYHLAAAAVHGMKSRNEELEAQVP